MLLNGFLNRLKKRIFSGRAQALPQRRGRLRATRLEERKLLDASFGIGVGIELLGGEELLVQNGGIEDFGAGPVQTVDLNLTNGTWSVDPGIVATQYDIRDGGQTLTVNHSLIDDGGAAVDGSDSLLIQGDDGETDTVTIDVSGLDFVPTGGIDFSGGHDSGNLDNDSLKIKGYTLTTADGVADVTVNHTGTDSGSVLLAGIGTIEFDDTEAPLTLEGTAADVLIQLPAGATNDVVLSDDAGPDNGVSQIASPTNDAFETTTFSNPTNSLTIVDGSGTKRINVEGLDSLYDADLTIDADSDDTVQVQTNDLETNGGDLTVNASNVGIEREIVTDGGDVEINADVTLGGDVTIDTGPGAGNINLIGAVTGGGNDLRLISGSGSITASAALSGIGELSLQEDAATSTGAVVFHDDVTADTLTTFAQPYDVAFLGSSTTITSGTVFNNAGVVTIGDAVADMFNGDGVVADGSTLGGDSTIVGNLRVNDGGTIAPGNSVGRINITGNLTLDPGATFVAEVASATQHDQISVTGTVELEGAILDLDTSFSPSSGTTYDITLIDNDGTDAITGTLDGTPDGMVDGFTDGAPDDLLDGALFVDGDFVGRIEYTRGLGNDLTIYSRTVVVNDASGSDYTLLRNGDDLELAILGGSTSSFELIDPAGERIPCANAVRAQYRRWGRHADSGLWEQRVHSHPGHVQWGRWFECHAT